jgi:hypothetical protein
VISIPDVSTIEPYTSILPLLFVLSVTAIREAYEGGRPRAAAAVARERVTRACCVLCADFQRHREDREINGRPIVAVEPTGSAINLRWSSIRVGDIVRVEDGQEFPADLLLLSSSDQGGTANIMTANLDGYGGDRVDGLADRGRAADGPLRSETNLKTRLALQQTKHLTTPRQLAELGAKIRAEPPNANLMQFDGTVIAPAPWQAPLTEACAQASGLTTVARCPSRRTSCCCV